MNKLNILLFMQIALFIVLTGIVCNFLVMTNNQGKMPFLADYYFQDEKHFTFQNNSQVEYPYLADRIIVGDYIASIGDFLMVGGFVLYFGLAIELFIQLKFRIDNIKKKKKP